MSEKRTLPLLPLRGLVVYPHMMVNLDVGRDRSVAAIESAIAGDSKILVVAQRDPECDDPTADDLYSVGAVAEIRQFLRMPEGVLRILVDGQKRAEILAIREGDAYAEADVHEIEESGDEPQGRDIEALVHGVTSKFEEWVKLSHKIPPEALVSISIMEDMGRLADIIASHLSLKHEVRQDLLAATDVRTQTQVRIAANIANGIKHAFNEFHASEILIGLHTHKDVSPKFWGQFHQSLFNGLNRQIIMARLNQPLNTIRRIQVAIPSRAQYEPGFYRWLERLARVALNLECRIVFHGRQDTLALVNEFVRNRHAGMRAEYALMNHWNELPSLASTIAPDHLFVVITARKGTVSYKTALDQLPDEITKFFSGTNLMIVFPDQYGDGSEELTFAEPQHTEGTSAYEDVGKWVKKLKK